MNKWWWCLATVVAAACGTVSDHQPDGGGSSSPTGASLGLAKTTRWVPQGANVQVPFTVTRTTSQGELTVHVDGLPAGVTEADTIVAAGATTGTLMFTATSGATLGSVTDSIVKLADGATPLDMKT